MADGSGQSLCGDGNVAVMDGKVAALPHALCTRPPWRICGTHASAFASKSAQSCHKGGNE